MTVAVLLVLGAGALTPAAAQPASSPAGSAPAPRRDAGAPSRPAGGEQLVTVKDGRLSVRVKDVPLGALLNEISRRARVAIVGRGTVGGHLVTAEFKDVSLEEGLRLLLKDRADYFLFYGMDPKGQKPAALQAVWVYPPGRGRGLEPAPLEETASVKELKERLRDQDPMVRARAIAALVEREGNRAQQETLEALKDPDPVVRRETLWWALEEGVTVPDERLRELAVNDPGKDVRILALQALSRQPGAREIAQQALNDPDPQVRRVAQEVLTRLDAPKQPPRVSPKDPERASGGARSAPPGADASQKRAPLR